MYAAEDTKEKSSFSVRMLLQSRDNSEIDPRGCFHDYKEYGTPIVSPPFLAKLYRNRKRIKIDEEKYPLILCTALMEKKGLGWYWLKDLDSTKILEIVKDQISNETEDIRNQAAKILGRIVNGKDKDIIIQMLQDEDWHVRLAAAKALDG